MTNAVFRSAQAGAILTALGLSAGLMTGVAEAAPPREHSCLSPIFSTSLENPNWRDLNLRYGVSERIIGPPAPATDDIADPPEGPGKPGCRTALAGEQWVRAVPPWITATPTERDAFITNFKGARYVIDRGTRQEQTITVSPMPAGMAGTGPGKLRSGTVPNDVNLPNGQPDPARGLPWVAPVSPVFHPLSSAITPAPSSWTWKRRSAPAADPPRALGTTVCPRANPSTHPGQWGFHSSDRSPAPHPHPHPHPHDTDTDTGRVIPGLGVRVVDRTRHRHGQLVMCRCQPRLCPRLRRASGGRRAAPGLVACPPGPHGRSVAAG